MDIQKRTTSLEAVIFNGSNPYAILCVVFASFDTFLLQVRANFASRPDWNIDVAQVGAHCLPAWPEHHLWQMKSDCFAQSHLGPSCGRGTESARAKINPGACLSLNHPHSWGTEEKGRKKKKHLQMTNDQHRLLAK